MKKIFFSFFLFFFFFIVNAQDKAVDVSLFGKKINPKNILSNGYVRCATNEYEEFLKNQNSKIESKDDFEKWIFQRIKEGEYQLEVASQSSEIIYIPVVVHVIHNGDAYGSNENITDEQVQSQITVLNQDFRKIIGTPGFNVNPVGVDTQIEFVLAKVDPNGNPTNGINRINLCEESWSTSDINTIVKPQTIWDPLQYMNMWCVNFSNSTLLGYAQFPSSSGLLGLNSNEGSANADGVVAGYRFFGSSDLSQGNYSAPFDKGRTMTHEVGHFLGLRHIWGDGDCTLDDFCADTPNAGDSNEGCPNVDSCPEAGSDMVENYMDYTNDSCMNIFTADQKARMLAVLNNSPRRSTLKSSIKDIAIPLFENDAELKIENYCNAATPSCSGNEHRVYIYNRGVEPILSIVVSYNVNNGPNNLIDWSGSILPNKYEIISFSTLENSGTLNISVSSVNNGQDQRLTNNSSSKSFSFSNSIPASYKDENYNFNLVKDNYGIETTWELKNSSGIVVHSGGPYSGDGSGSGIVVENVNWILSPDCYTFTIFDTAGDGICCAFGSGSWKISTNSGSIIVGSGGNFSSSESISFSSQIASDSSNEIVVYPNPSNDNFTINLPVDIERKGTVEIYNSIGQQITVKSIQSDADLNVNVSSLSNGVYFLKLNFAGSTKTMKFIKN